MTIPDSFQHLTETIGDVQASLGRAQEQVADPAIRRQLDALGRQIQQGHAEVAQAYQQSMASVQQRLQNVNEKVESAQKAVAEHQQAAKAAPAAAPPVQGKRKVKAPQREGEIDPELGPRLRSEILDRFARKPQQQPSTNTSREVWEDWDDWDKTQR